MGNPLLREQSILFEPDEITSVETQELVKDMWETMDEYGGVGLAAPQIGVSKQLAVIRIEEDTRDTLTLKNRKKLLCLIPR